MKWGLIARAEDRGLGNLTWEVYRNLGPDRTLVVDMGDLARGFPMHHDRYRGCDSQGIAFESGHLDEAEVRGWLDGLDVVYTAETFYDWRIPTWAAEQGVATVLHVMPEFLPPQAAIVHPEITAWWNPTPWRMRHLPAGAVYVPVPVAADRFPAPGPREPGPLRVLHTAGHRAAHDRNGTLSVLMAARRLRRPAVVTITGQDDRLPTCGGIPAHVEVRYENGGHVDYWSPYAGHDVIVMPRRYGGLCLPVQEAMAAGLAAVMPDCSPNPDMWPVVTVKSNPQGSFRCAPGDLPVITTSAREIAAVLDGFSDDPGPLCDAQGNARAWAAEHSWAALRETWLAELGAAARGRRR